jgi:NADH-quinone oxidoreductase subunit M
MAHEALNQILAVDQIGVPILTLTIFLPLAGFVAVAMLDEERTIRWVAMVTVLLDFLASLAMLPGFVRGVPDMQFVERVPWIPPLGISYHVGVDGISLLLILLTTFLAVLIVLFSWRTITESVKGYMVCLLLLQTTMIGVFAALDLVLFFLFWEIMLIPMYFLIKIWGGANRDYASLKFVVYTLLGSVLMLVGFVILYLNYHDIAAEQGLAQIYSFDYFDLLSVPISTEKQLLVFLLIFFGFAFKVPMFPFHTWLPDAHTEAPTAGSVVLAGVLLKMGTYGFVRFSLPLLPEASRLFVPFMSTLAVIGIVYGAFLALAQFNTTGDMKRLIAYSSISHLGFVVLGIFALNPQGILGGMIQMLNHGISTAGLFLVVGFLYERRHTRQISEYGGLMRRLPLLASFYLIISFSSMGVPGTNGFVGEFLILSGAFKSDWRYAAWAVGGVILGASYLLWLYYKLMVGKIENPRNETLSDLDRLEATICAALVVVILWVGFYPSPFLRIMEGSMQNLVAKTGRAGVVVENRQTVLPVADRLPESAGPDGTDRENHVPSAGIEP